MRFVDTGRVLTSAGGAAGIDMCLPLIRRDHGASVANPAARRRVVAPWRDGGQAQFIEAPLPKEKPAHLGPRRRTSQGKEHEHAGAGRRPRRLLTERFWDV